MRVVILYAFGLLVGPTRVHSANDTSIGSAVFAALTNVYNRHTDRQSDMQTTLQQE